MNIEQNRRIEAAAHAALMKERFANGYLSRWQTLRQWVVWKTETEDETAHKVPYNPGRPSYRASIKRVGSWGTLAQTLAAYSSGRFSGIGFMVTPPFVLVDLDDSYNRVNMQITRPEAREIIETLASATEASPNTGIHIYAEGLLPGKNLHTPEIELYTNWFTTVTTDHTLGTPRDIQPRQEQLAELYKRFAPPPLSDQNQIASGGLGERPRPVNSLTSLPPEAERDVLLQQLLAGDLSAYQGDESRADFVLILKLLHWTGDDEALTRKLFVESGLYREEKTTRRTGPTTYLDMTIRNAIKKRRNKPMDR